MNPPSKENGALLIVAPNGARPMPSDHARVPITPEQTAQESLAAMQAGAAMVHLHARDENGVHSLDPQLNLRYQQAVREACGNGIVIQLTTEAVGRFTPEQQMTLIYETQPEAASFALRELIPTDSDEDLSRGREFFQWVQQQGILAQYILYSAEDIQRYHRLKTEGVLPAENHHLLFVLGRYSGNFQSEPTELIPMLTAHQDDTRWALCAFGRKEHLCAGAALALGGDTRIGFENNMLDKLGNPATSNASQIAQAADACDALGRPVLSAAQVRSLFGMPSPH